MKKILVTGAKGFIGKNLILALSEIKDIEILEIVRESSDADLIQKTIEADVIVHLAGANRPEDDSEFEEVNSNFTKRIIDIIEENGKKVKFILASSIQAELNNPYGKSKKAAEDVVLDFKRRNKSKVFILRLPGVFGKFCKPNYNSVVATFCYNIGRDLEIQISDKDRQIRLVFIDSVIRILNEIILTSNLDGYGENDSFLDVEPIYDIRLGELAEIILNFKKSRSELLMDNVGNGFLRALYSTFISYLPNDSWSYEIPLYSDPRGTFVEMLKTKDSGQFSFFTAHPGVTRGEHYHHTKTEKFLVIRGKARFQFRNVISNEYYELLVSGDKPTIVDTIPGWAHNITNVGSEEMIVMLWANEVFDRNLPDTFSSKVKL